MAVYPSPVPKRPAERSNRSTVLLPLVDPNVTVALTGSGMQAFSGTVKPDWHIISAQGELLPGQLLTGAESVSEHGEVVPDSTVPLVGADATSAAGTIVATATQPISGSESTLAAGTTVPAFDVSLVGEALTSAAGTLAPEQESNDVTEALTGEASTTAAGDLGPGTALVPNGLSGTCEAGECGLAGTIPCLGEASSSAAGTLVALLSLPLTGEAATGDTGTLTYVETNDKEAALTGEAMQALLSAVGTMGGTYVTGDGSGGGRRTRVYAPRSFVTQYVGPRRR